MSAGQGHVVRTYQPDDLQALRAVFHRATAGDLPVFGTVGDEAVWLRSYLELSPATVLLAFLDGHLAGYLTGSTGDCVPSEVDRVMTAFRRDRAWRDRHAMRFLARSLLDRVRDGGAAHAEELDDPRWPAHLHVRLAPEARGRGAGTALVRRWQAILATREVPGCHLQVTAEHVRAVSFFGGLGFVAHGPPALIPGLRDQGRRIHQQTMVWSTDGTRGRAAT